MLIFRRGGQTETEDFNIRAEIYFEELFGRICLNFLVTFTSLPCSGEQGKQKRKVEARKL